MNPVIWTYGFYLTASVLLTIWVAKTLHKNGRVFLVEAFHGKEQLADSVNHLLVVGFYLINIGYVSLALKYGDKPSIIKTSASRRTPFIPKGFLTFTLRQCTSL